MSLLEYSCKICSSEPKDIDPAVLCDRCENWIHADNCAIIGEPSTKTQKKVHFHVSVPIVPWNFPSLQSKTKSFKYFTMALLINEKENKRIPENVS